MKGGKEEVETHTIVSLLGMLTLTVALTAAVAVRVQVHGRGPLHSEGAVALLFTPLQNPLSAIVQAALAGFFVEGVASWGMGSLFPRD